MAVKKCFLSFFVSLMPCIIYASVATNQSNLPPGNTKINKSQSVQSPKTNAPSIATYQPTVSPANFIPPITWEGPDLSAVIVGGASAGFSKPSGGDSAFNILDFNPILLFSYKELLFLRSSVDFSLDNQGNTSVNLDYANLNLFLNDYAVLGIGKFDSGLGYFVQNLSPAWINRMPDSPVGFASDEAAPQSEIGLRLQGGLPLLFNQIATNYILFISNANQGVVDIATSVIDYVGSNGYLQSSGNYLYGGRFGILPIPKLEIGISAATGKISLIDSLNTSVVLQNNRSYHVLGADFSYKPGHWDLRAEIIQQQVPSQSGSVAEGAQTWRAWYGQVAYWIPNTQWEPVIRYSKFTTSIVANRERQWAFGVDYWFAPSIALQTSFELNKGEVGTSQNTNTFLMQLAFGY